MDGTLERPLVSDASIRSVNFFNGRMLSAEDMNQEKLANREGRQQLGRAIGAGVACGLEVVALSADSASPRVTVTPGLAINRRGQALALDEAVSLALARPAERQPARGPASFDECLPPQGGVYIVDEGIYLLTLGPAQQDEGRARVSGLSGNGAGHVRYKVEAVQFRLTALSDLLTDELNDPSRLRNRLAYRCFGADDPRWRNSLRDPFGASPASYGLMDDLRAANRLTPCDVPLAVVHWRRAEIGFVDMWSVRRRITAPTAATHFPHWTGDRRQAEGEAMFMQFQAQEQEILRDVATSPETVIATQRFNYLPPVGILPLAGGSYFKGFDEQRFFEGVTSRSSEFIEGAQVPVLVRMAMLYPPIDLKSGLMLRLYRVRENIQANDQRSRAFYQEYLVFASGHTPYLGGGRYDVNHWEYASFA